ncbi:MAG: CRTAC1 family protein [Phycisphaerales bacterium]|nr:CRTAC1 family protein [Planctomycetota bacterium]MBL6998000.1 CRTAC1 family protein [Phycisphaerales bacterium]
MIHHATLFIIVLSQTQDTIWLEDQADERGVSLNWVSGDTGTFNMPEIIGGGAALLDFDNDGDLDIYFVQGGHFDSKVPEENILLRNDDGMFIDVTQSSNTGDTGYGMGVATGDFNNDTFVDIFITNVGKNVLLQNNGDGTFKDVTSAAGVGEDGWGASAAFADFDADGDLDLYVINYLVWAHGLVLECFNAKGMLDYCSPTNYMAPAKDLLYRNNGDGTFTDMSEPAGIGTRTGTGLGVLCNDYTGDGKIDIFVANDGMADQLWQNNGSWSFTDVAAMRGCALDDEGKAKAGMGVTTDDFDNDGDFDILVCNLFGESDSLYLNEGEYFVDITARKGIRTATRHATRFGLGWVDFNNDGFLDLYEANGRVQMIGTAHTADPFAEENYLLQGTAKKWELIKGIKNPKVHTSRAAVFGDINNDGGIDVLVVNRDAPAYLLMNVHPDRDNSVTFRVIDSHGRDALGAVVTAKVNNKTITHPVQSAWSYMAANDPRVHFGLGDANGVTDVTVRWVDGSKTTFGSFDKGFHILKED